MLEQSYFAVEKACLKPQLLADSEISDYLKSFSDWQLVSTDCTSKLVFKYALSDYLLGVQLVSDIARIADTLAHHPEISLSYSSLVISTTTHSLQDKLSLNDFILAHQISLWLVKIQ